MIQDLDGVAERQATLGQRWLLPALGTIAVVAVLASTLARQLPSRPPVLQVAPVLLLRIFLPEIIQ